MKRYTVTDIELRRLVLMPRKLRQDLKSEITRKNEVPAGGEYLTREQVSEAISLCWEYGNAAICNYLFGMPAMARKRS